ncbi:hypothetical protein HO133_004788 [Letharia lupina]|uniref:GTPase-activating protein GYP5 n=1 Tax=Letharia lupina TaxID=560253 RepID=A0A8H6KZY7_9LECA|nr:uncharacterized protein HO133_004788 [Letharia lupina]KAF6230445.1 hypothetical protein HO133_004788 [Letharia lupina]
MADNGPIPSSADSSDREGDTFEDAQDNSDRPQSHRSSASSRSLTNLRPPSSPSTPRGSNVQSSEETSVHKQEARIPDNEDTPTKSPLLTAHRISASSLNNVQLDGTNDTNSIRSDSTATATTEKSMATSPPKLPIRSQGLSGNLPSIPWGPPPASKPTVSTPFTAPPPRKLGMSFSWLSRSTSGTKDAVPSPSQVPTPRDRRNTVTSIASIGSNPELMLSKLDEGQESDNSTGAKRQRNSLRDRFKMLRMREEAGIQSLEGQDVGSPTASGGALAALIGRGASVGLGIGSPTSVVDEKEGGLAGTASPLQSPVSTVPPANPITSTTNPNLAPGTASGVSAGPSAMTDPAAAVDWDLWQSVVYEGPSAVARTSAEELSMAIASGIPSAIRGVVWQVLAQSKNDELEGVYRELVVRGTDKDRDHMAAANGHALTNLPMNGSAKEKHSIASSASSMHSGQSTPATTATNGLTSPSHSQLGKDAESMKQLQAAMMAERKKKVKEDAAALQKLEKVIRKDLGARTSYSKYAVAAGLQEGLFGVCKAYALFDEGVGYAQGMNFLIMPLLFNMPEEEAFCLLVRLMNQYHLRDMFIQDMPGLHLHLYQFERLLEDMEPALYCHLHRKGVAPQLYATQWFLTLFAYRFPLQLVLRVYDLILSEGLEGAILKFGIALMQKNADNLVGMNDMSSLTNFLKDRLFDVYIDQAPSANSLLESGFFGSSGGGIDKEIYRADILVQDACAVRITPEMLKHYTSEWEEKQRSEKEREAELETLRSTNASLALKVRSLEERTEKSDTEHVQMASELVRTKVENQELYDSVESLRGQTDELRSMVEKQPEEVEQRLKEEMDRIMKRNIEVQNENRALEEQIADMEKTLVETKMQFAEINGEYDSLKQKWTDLRKAIES